MKRPVFILDTLSLPHSVNVFLTLIYPMNTVEGFAL